MQSDLNCIPEIAMTRILVPIYSCNLYFLMHPRSNFCTDITYLSNFLFTLICNYIVSVLHAQVNTDSIPSVHKAISTTTVYSIQQLTLLARLGSRRTQTHCLTRWCQHSEEALIGYRRHRWQLSLVRTDRTLKWAESEGHWSTGWLQFQ